MAEGNGITNIVTFRQILLDYYNSHREDDEEVQKRAILLTASKLIKGDIKNNSCVTWGYITKSGRTKTCACIILCPSKFAIHASASVRWERYVHKGSWHWASSYSSSAVIVPLQLGFAVQMCHLHRSRFLVDSLSTMGFSSSYREV